MDTLDSKIRISCFWMVSSGATDHYSLSNRSSWRDLGGYVPPNDAWEGGDRKEIHETGVREAKDTETLSADFRKHQTERGLYTRHWGNRQDLKPVSTH